MSELIIQTNDLTKKYKDKKAVDAINMNVSRGEIYGFIGRNGAGKTTTLKMFANLVEPSQGHIKLFGNSVNQINRKRIGILIENPGLYPNLNAYDNLKMKCILNNVKNPDRRVKELLTLVKLDGVNKKKKAKNFSLGMKQRLGIALALVSQPELLLLDEPINGLDPQGIVEIRELLLKLKNEYKMTIVISSHILEELGKICDRYGVISEGKLIKELSNEELENSGKSFINIHVDDVDKSKQVLSSLSINDYEVDDSIIRLNNVNVDTALINAKLVVSGVAVSSIYEKHEDVESMFIQMMGGANYA